MVVRRPVVVSFFCAAVSFPGWPGPRELDALAVVSVDRRPQQVARRSRRRHLVVFRLAAQSQSPSLVVVSPQQDDDDDDDDTSLPPASSSSSSGSPLGSESGTINPRRRGTPRGGPEELTHEVRRARLAGTLTYAKATRVLRSAKTRLTPHACVRLFEEIAQGVEVSEHLASFALDACATRGDASSAEKLVRDLRDQHDVEPTAVSYCILLKAFGRAAEFSESTEAAPRRLRARKGVDRVLREMARRRVEPDVIFVNALVDALARCGDAAEAARLVRSLLAVTDDEAASSSSSSSNNNENDDDDDVAWLAHRMRFVEPNAKTFNAALKGLARSGDAVAAYALADAMDRARVRRTSVTDATLAFALATSGKRRVAGRVARDISDFEEEDVDDRDQLARTAAFTSTIRGADSVAAARAVIEEMKARDVPRNAHTYTELLVTCGRLAPFEDSFVDTNEFSDDNQHQRPPAHDVIADAWALMLADGVTPTPITYNAAIAAYLRKRPVAASAAKRAFGLVAELRRQRVRFDEDSEEDQGGGMTTSTLNTLVSALIETPEFEKLAFSLFSKAAAGKKQNGDESNNTALGTLPAADCATFSVVLKALGKRHDARRVGSTWRAMTDRFPLDVDTVAANTYLDALVKCDDCKAAVKALEAMEDAAPLTTTSSAVSSSASSNGGDKDLDAPPPPVTWPAPDVVSYSTVIHALAKEPNAFAPRKAVRLYETFVARCDDARRRDFSGEQSAFRRRGGSDVAYSRYSSSSSPPHRHRRRRGHKMARRLAPDAGLVRAALAACAGLRERALSLDDDPADAARRVLDAARPWLSNRDYDACAAFARDTVLGPSASEAWKHDGVADELLSRKHWNAFDSGFRFL